MKSFLILICLTFINCKIIRLTGNENLTFKSNEMKFELDRAIEVNVKVDNNNEVFFFDTGASNTIIFDTLLIKDFSTKKRINSFGVKDPNGKILSFYTPVNIETDLYFFENQLVTVYTKTKNLCSESFFCKGIIGASIFKKSNNKTYLLDFDKLILKNDDEFFKKKEFTEVKSVFFNNHFAVYLNIDGHEESFLFDTGNIAYPIIIGSNSKIKAKKYVEYLGSESFVVSGSVKENTKYSNKNDVLISDNFINSPICFTSKKNMNNHNNIGLDFIKYFNWIIDFKNQKVFFKRNNLIFNEIDIVPIYKYLCIINDGKLEIITKKIDEIKYNLNDEIISVNNAKVTPDNICDMQNLLNNTLNWDELNLEIKSKI